MRLALILVHFHTPTLVAAALEALQRDLAHTGLEVEWVVVDNGSDAAGRSLLRTLPARLATPGRNLGYAGGANLGIRETSADWVIVMNPDVFVMSGCVPTLLDVLASGAGVAGPRFYLDDECTMLLPPTERTDPTSAVLRALAERGTRLAALARRRWRAHARRHWLARGTITSHDLSGSLLAFPRATWHRAGPFDEAFALYFEETEWLRRVVRTGLRAAYVPEARAVHHYARSVARQPDAQTWFEASRRRFARLRYGRLGAITLDALAHGSSRRPPMVREAGASLRAPPSVPLSGIGPCWLEVSASLRGFPAAGFPVDQPSGGVWELPHDVWHRLQSGTYRIQEVTPDGRERGAWSFSCWRE